MDLLDEFGLEDRVGRSDLAGDLARPRPEDVAVPAVGPRWDEEADVPRELGEQRLVAPTITVRLSGDVSPSPLSQMSPVKGAARIPALARIEVVDLLDRRQPDLGVLLEIGVKPGRARSWGADPEERRELCVASPAHGPPREHRSPGPGITSSVR